ncbi:MAG: hypothetical protein VB050_03430 [Geobacteraceae bacterium]|nr:hypothetical protein [Geobacteraceae bacterium]
MAGKKRLDVDSETALAAVSEERDLERIRQENQAEREQLIAQSHEIIGRVQANTLMSKFANVSNLVHLKNIKESKIYRDLPMVGTWDKYCEYLGLSRQKVDEDLANLAAFGEDFLLTCQQFSLGYRDLRKLRQLTHDGTIQVIDGAVEIAGEKIPLDEDHKEDLQAAIEKIAEEQTALREEMAAQKKATERVQKDTHKSLVKLQKENDQFRKKAEARGLTLEEDGFITQVAGYRDLVQGSFIALDPNAEDNIIPPDLTPRMRAALISTAHNLKMQALALYDTLVSVVGDPAMNPEMLEDYEKWLEKYHEHDEAKTKESPADVSPCVACSNARPQCPDKCCKDCEETCNSRQKCRNK